MLLREAVRLWFAIRSYHPALEVGNEKLLTFILGHGIGTSTIGGNRPRGMEPIHDPDNPFDGGMVPDMPRMIVAQFDSIRYGQIRRAVPRFLKLLESILTSKNFKPWFTVYLVIFLLLDLVSSASRDRRRHAVDNSELKPMVRLVAIELLVR